LICLARGTHRVVIRFASADWEFADPQSYSWTGRAQGLL